MKYFAAPAWQLLLFTQILIVNCQEPAAPTLTGHQDDVPELVVAATSKLAAQLDSLVSSDRKASKAVKRLRQTAVLGAAVHTNVAVAIGRLQKSLKATSLSMAEWAQANDKRLSSIVFSAGAEYKAQQEKVLQSRHVLAKFLNASHQRQAPFLLKVAQLEATQKALELEVQQRQHALDVKKAASKKKARQAIAKLMDGGARTQAQSRKLRKALPSSQAVKAKPSGSDLHLVGGMHLESDVHEGAKKTSVKLSKNDAGKEVGHQVAKQAVAEKTTVKLAKHEAKKKIGHQVAKEAVAKKTTVKLAKDDAKKQVGHQVAKQAVVKKTAVRLNKKDAEKEVGNQVAKEAAAKTRAVTLTKKETPKEVGHQVAKTGADASNHVSVAAPTPTAKQVPRAAAPSLRAPAAKAFAAAVSAAAQKASVEAAPQKHAVASKTPAVAAGFDKADDFNEANFDNDMVKMKKSMEADLRDYLSEPNELDDRKPKGNKKQMSLSASAGVMNSHPMVAVSANLEEYLSGK